VELNRDQLIAVLAIVLPAIWILIKYVIGQFMSDREHIEETIEEIKRTFVHRDELRSELTRIEHQLERIEGRITEIFKLLIKDRK